VWKVTETNLSHTVTLNDFDQSQRQELLSLLTDLSSTTKSDPESSSGTLLDGLEHDRIDHARDGSLATGHALEGHAGVEHACFDSTCSFDFGHDTLSNELKDGWDTDKLHPSLSGGLIDVA
jgi:hypothetical protein